MRAAGEDYDSRVELSDGVEGIGSGHAKGEDGELADAAGYEVGVLGAVVEDEHEAGGAAGRYAVGGLGFDDGVHISDG